MGRNALVKVGTGLGYNKVSEIREQIQRGDFHRVVETLVALVKHCHKSYFTIIKEMDGLILTLFH